MKFVCFLGHLIAVLAAVYIVLSGRMTVNVKRNCVVPCEIQVEEVVFIH